MIGESHFSDDEFDRRVAAIHAQLEVSGLDALLVFTSALFRIPGAVTYCCGYEPLWGSAVFLYVPSTSSRHVLIDDWWDVQGRLEVTLERAREECLVVDDLGSAVALRLGPEIKRVGLVNDALSLSGPWASVQTALSGREVVDASALLNGVRELKSPAELDALRETAAISDVAASAFYAAAIQGQTEIEVARIVHCAALSAGADSLWTHMMVASGPRSAVTYALPSERALVDGDTVHLDLGVKRNGYHGDIKRSVVLPPASSEARYMLEALIEIQGDLIRDLKPGRLACDIHFDFIRLAQEHGVADCIAPMPPASWLLGHGIGADGHESPSIHPSDQTLLREGMVMTIEPSLHKRNLGGIGLEDMVLITSDGGLRLTCSPWTPDPV